MSRPASRTIATGDRLAAKIGASLVVAMFAVPASAQIAKPTSAETLFRDGEALYRAGNTHAACEKFAASYDAEPAPGALRNLAVCHDKEGKTATAWREFLHLAELATQAKKPEHERWAREQAAALEARLSRVQVTAPPNASLKAVSIDGTDADPSALTAGIPVDPGDHTVVATDESGAQAKATVTVPPGPSTTPVALEWPSQASAPLPSVVKPPAPAPSAPDATVRPSQSSHVSAMTVAGWSLVGAGVVGIGTGSVFGLLAFAHRNDRPNDSAFTYATISTVAFSVGVGAALAGGLLLFFRAKHHEAKTTSAVSIEPLLGIGGGGVLLRGSW